MIIRISNQYMTPAIWIFTLSHLITILIIRVDNIVRYYKSEG